VWNTSANLLTGLISFLVVPVVLIHLGETQYGVWALVGSIFSYTSLLQLGFSSAINREIPVAIVRQDESRLRQVTSTACVFFGFSSALALLTTFAFTYGFTRWFKIPSQLAPISRQTVLVVGLLFSLALWFQPFMAILSGYQRYDLMAVSRVVPWTLRGVLLVWLLSQSPGLTAVSLIYGMSEFAMGAMSMFFALRLLPSSPATLGTASLTLFRSMFPYAVNTFMYSVGAVTVSKATELVLGVALSPQHVTRYSLCSTAVLMVSGVVEPFCAALKPAITELHERSESGRLVAVALSFQRLVLFLAIPSLSGMIILGREFLRVWTHTDSGEVAIVVALLAVGHFFRLSQHSNFLVLVGMGKHEVFGRLTLVMSVAAAALAALSVGLGWGVIGAAAGNMLALVAFCGILVPAHFHRQIGLPWRRALSEGWLPAVKASGPPVLLLLGWKVLSPPGGWLGFGLVAVTAGLVMLLSVWFLGFNQTERSALLKPIALRLGQLRKR
jgi:O-antigen/teichoic acid export membrane protein